MRNTLRYLGVALRELFWVLVAVAIIRDVDALELDDGGNLAVITGPVLFKNSIHLPKSSIQFIGIDIG